MRNVRTKEEQENACHILVVLYVIAKFSFYLVGSKMIVYTDNMDIRYILNQKDANPRLIQ